MFQQLLCQRADKAVIDDAENRRYRISRDRPFTGSGALVEQADCIAHTAISLAGNQRCGVSRDLDLFLLGDVKRERTVIGSLCGAVVAKIKIT